MFSAKILAFLAVMVTMMHSTQGVSLTQANLAANCRTSPMSPSFLGCSNITAIEANAFSALPSTISSITLFKNNLLTIINVKAFTGLSSLNYLDLGFNKLSLLTSGTFSSLTGLGGLNLESNRLASVSVATFTGLSSLTWLNLANNQLGTFNPAIAASLPKLETLWLDGNGLRVIQPLTGPSSLIMFFAENNLLTSIAKNTFTAVPNLQNLRFRNNSLTSFDGSLIANERQLLSLAISGNKFTLTAAYINATRASAKLPNLAIF